MSGILNFIIHFITNIQGATSEVSYNSFISLLVVACGVGFIVLIVKLITKLKAFALFGG